MHSVVKSIANVRKCCLQWEDFTKLTHMLVREAINLVKFKISQQNISKVIAKYLSWFLQYSNLLNRNGKKGLQEQSSSHNCYLITFIEIGSPPISNSQKDKEKEGLSTQHNFDLRKTIQMKCISSIHIIYEYIFYLTTRPLLYLSSIVKTRWLQHWFL